MSFPSPTYLKLNPAAFPKRRLRGRLFLLGTALGFCLSSFPLLSKNPVETGDFGTGPKTTSKDPENSIRLRPLPAPINSTASEFSPSLSRDGKTLIFSKKKPGQRYGDLYVSHKKKGIWQNPRPLQILNSPYSDEAPFLSPDGKTIFFSSDRDGSMEMPKDARGRIKVSYDLYWSRKIGGHWQRPVPIRGVNSLHHERSPAWDAKRKILYFTQWPFGDFKRARIMMARYRNGRFERPAPLPPEINSGHMEAGFVPADNGKGYYFASRRPGGQGGWDIWFVAYQDGLWGEPVNMGPDINSPQNEIFLTVRLNSIYLCSNRLHPKAHGGYDIYTAFIGKYIHLRVLDKLTKKPLELPLVMSEDGRLLSKAQTNAQGRASLPLRDPRSHVLGIRISEAGYLPLKKHIKIDEALSSQKEVTIYLEPIRKNQSFTLHNIHFGYNSDTIQPESKAVLDRLANYLKKNPNRKIEIIGHTDRHGSDTFNLDLSRRRAIAVRDALVKRGLKQERFQIRGEGFRRPLSTAETKEADRKNRRTEFRFLGN